MSAFIQGFAMGGGLIVAIGAQNAFVLTQAVRSNHILPVVLVCILCDGALLGLGVSGVGTLVAASPILGKGAAWGGAAFLGWYGLGSLRSAMRGGSLNTDRKAPAGLRRTLLLTLGVTLLNPHVYLDTVVLMGSLSGRFEGSGRYLFGLGAVTASTLWFALLGAGGRMLAPLFRRPATWRVLDTVVCLTMWTIAVALIRSTL
ncbi:amino acid transporter [Pseudodesulfovibrio sp. F-1]|uniref:Amino acid transporter n=1 Tax=Pseudodesulfovibrio alkaliphilus TaxID=2661613 RepID=A0A7K1KNK8_9BACT|nr:LysE/ArgO family amino acid transporter [Pseudodesulfovibrio alkaliphilus]MUM77663.1 amino acid transporter [Pseudodesulfovibrio alkaliphilus]